MAQDLYSQKIPKPHLGGRSLRGNAYRVSKGQPYVRREYISGSPSIKITKFVMGNPKGSYNHKLSLQSLRAVQIQHNALEAARISVNKILFDEIGGEEYMLRIRVYPHVILRENKMLATAGADRLQEGMRRAFGKSVSRAARVKVGDPIIQVYVNEPHLGIGRKALKVGASKLPTPSNIITEKIKLAEAK